MALAGTGDTLGQAMYDALVSQLGWTPPSGDADIAVATFKVLAAEIVAHIVAEAEVTSSGATLAGSPGGPLTITDLAGSIE